MSYPRDAWGHRCKLVPKSNEAITAKLPPLPRATMARIAATLSLGQLLGQDQHLLLRSILGLFSSSHRTIGAKRLVQSDCISIQPLPWSYEDFGIDMRTNAGCERYLIHHRLIHISASALVGEGLE